MHLFDSRTRKEILLEDVENIEFYNSDQAAYYQVSDSTGNAKTILLELPSGTKTEWTYKEAFRPAKGIPYSISVTNVPKDTINHVPSFDRLIVRHLKTALPFKLTVLVIIPCTTKDNLSSLYVNKRKVTHCVMVH